MRLLLKQGYFFWLIVALAWLALACSIFFTFPITNPDQLHYLDIAQEMLHSHSYLMTIAGGHIDLQKPPLLYWLIMLGWSTLGVGTGWPSALMFLTAFATMVMLFLLAKQLYPKQEFIPYLAITILLACFYWPTFAARIRFDGLIGLFSLLSINGFVMAARRQLKWPLIFSSLGITLGLLTKGPVIFIFTVPYWLLAPKLCGIKGSSKQYFINSATAIVFSFALPIAWIISVIHQYGSEIATYLALKQPAGRFKLEFHSKVITHTFSNFFPWTLLPSFWLNLIKVRAPSAKTLYFLLCISIPVIFFMCFMKNVTTRYFVPFYPQVALLIALTLSRQKYPQLRKLENYCISTILLVAGITVCLLPHISIPVLEAKIEYHQISSFWCIPLLTAAAVLYYMTKKNKPYMNTPWPLASAFVIAAIVIHAGIIGSLSDNFMLPFAQRVKALQDKGIQVINYNTNTREALQFYGHVKPMPYILTRPEMKKWYLTHPHDWFWARFPQHRYSDCLKDYTYKTNNPAVHLVLAPVVLYNQCKIYKFI